MTPIYARNGKSSSGNGDFSSKYANILQTLTVVGVVLGGVYAGIVAPLKDELRDLKYDKLSMAEHGEFKLREDKQLEALQNEINALKSEVAYLRDNQVTRAEHTTHWDQTKENIASAVKSIDELRRDFGGQYTTPRN
jgi:hypothetical protein